MTLLYPERCGLHPRFIHAGDALAPAAELLFGSIPFAVHPHRKVRDGISAFDHWMMPDFLQENPYY